MYSRTKKVKEVNDLSLKTILEFRGLNRKLNNVFIIYDMQKHHSGGLYLRNKKTLQGWNV